MHARYVQRMARELFRVPVSLLRKRGQRAVVVFISSRTVCDILVSQGVPCGNKIRLGVTIPDWILGNHAYLYSFARGLFDADGCVFQDTHRIQGRIYRHVGIAFANSEVHLLTFFHETLEGLGLHPTQTSKNRVFLRRRNEVDAYFDIIGTSNAKQQSRYEAYRKRRGG